MRISAMTNTRRFLLELFIALLLVFGGNISALAQPSPVDVQIDRATADRIVNASDRQRGWAVILRFNKPFDVTNPEDTEPATNPGNYRVININDGSPVPVSEAQFIKTPGAVTLLVRLVIPTPDALNADDFFHVYALRLRFSGAPPREALQSRVEVRGVTDTTSTAEIDPQEEPRANWALKTSKNRDDSDVYASYEVTSARDTATTGTGDVKVAVPFFGNFWARTSKFSPFFDLKASSNHKADADSLKFGLEWFLPVYVNDNPDSTFLFPAVDWINTGKIEAPKNFDNINAIWENRWLFPSAQIPGDGKRFRMFLDPFIGSELGRNLKNPLKEARDKAIFRLYVGANLTINVPIRDVSLLKGIDFTSSYIRRWPLKRELSIKEADGGTFTLLTFDKGPKDYSDSKFIVKINDFFGPFIGYEWGRLPPNYDLVDHKWTFGVLFKSKIRVK